MPVVRLAEHVSEPICSRAAKPLLGVFGDHPNASITRCFAGAFGSMAARAHMIRLTLTVHLDDERRAPRVHAGGLRFLSLLFMFLEPVSTVVGHRVDHGIGRASRNLPGHKPRFDDATQGEQPLGGRGSDTEPKYRVDPNNGCASDDE